MNSKPPSNVTQTTTNKMGPEQQKLFNLAFPFAEQYASTPLQQFQGSGISPFTASEQTAQDLYKGVAAPTAQGLAGQAAGVQSGVLMNPDMQLDVANNPYLKAAAEAMGSGVTQNLMENQLPALRGGATMAGGAYSGASTKSGIAEGKAVGGTNAGIADAVTRMMFDAYKGGMGTLSGAVNNNAGVMGQQTMGADILGAVGAQERSMYQAQLDEQIRNFYTAQELPFIQAQELLGLINGMPGGTLSSQVSGAMPGANPLMQGLGMGMMGTSLLTSLMKLGPMLGALSDRLEKYDVEELGQLPGGLHVYQYKYKDDPDSRVYTGLMAQEVEELVPDAVFENEAGTKYVDYGKALGFSLGAE